MTHLQELFERYRTCRDACPGVLRYFPTIKPFQITEKLRQEAIEKNEAERLEALLVFG